MGEDQENGSAKVTFTIKEVLAQMREEADARHRDLKDDLKSVKNDVKSLKVDVEGLQGESVTKQAQRQLVGKLYAGAFGIVMLFTSIPAAWYYIHGGSG